METGGAPARPGPATAASGKPSEVDSAARLGAGLRAARDRRGLSRADVARETRIPIRALASLEDGEFDSLPAEVFARGFLRSYAEAVGLDAEATLKAYDACRRSSPDPHLDLRTPELSGSDDLQSSAAGRSARADRRRHTARRTASLLALIGLALTVARCVAIGT